MRFITFTQPKGTTLRLPLLPLLFSLLLTSVLSHPLGVNAHLESRAISSDLRGRGKDEVHKRLRERDGTIGNMAIVADGELDVGCLVRVGHLVRNE